MSPSRSGDPDRAVAHRLRASPLPRGGFDHEPVEVRANPDLAGEARIGPDVEGEVQHVLLHGPRLPGRLAPLLRDVDVAGRAGASPPALGLDARDPVTDGGLHDRRAFLGLDGPCRALCIDKGDLDHGAPRRKYGYLRPFSAGGNAPCVPVPRFGTVSHGFRNGDARARADPLPRQTIRQTRSRAPEGIARQRDPKRG